MKKYDLAVVIGRFQPIHKGHIPAFAKASLLADNIVCVIGTANKPSTPKNPFSVEQRKSMILAALAEEFGAEFNQKISFISVEDTFYLEQEWFRRVKKEVGEIEKRIIENKKNIKSIAHAAVNLADELVKLNLSTEQKQINYVQMHGKYDPTSQKIETFQSLSKELNTCTVTVLGHDKDPSTYYLNKFANWEFADIGAWVGDSNNDHPISATDIRDLWFSGKLSFAKSNLHTCTYNALLDWDQNSYLDLREDWEYIQNYRKQTQVGPFPVQFLTTDAVVIHGDEVLMIRRGTAPGKGLWALPGGFKGEKETFFESCLRELREETRISVPEKVLRGSVKEEKMFDFPERSSRGTTVSMAYSFVLDPTQPRPRVKGGDDAVMAWWFPLSQVLEMRDQIFEDHLDIIEFMTNRL